MKARLLALAARLRIVRIRQVIVPIVVMPDHAPRVTIDAVTVSGPNEDGWVGVTYRARPLVPSDSIEGWAARPK